MNVGPTAAKHLSPAARVAVGDFGATRWPPTPTLHTTLGHLQRHTLTIVLRAPRQPNEQFEVLCRRRVRIAGALVPPHRMWSARIAGAHFERRLRCTCWPAFVLHWRGQDWLLHRRDALGGQPQGGEPTLVPSPAQSVLYGMSASRRRRPDSPRLALETPYAAVRARMSWFSPMAMPGACTMHARVSVCVLLHCDDLWCWFVLHLSSSHWRSPPLEGKREDKSNTARRHPSHSRPEVGTRASRTCAAEIHAPRETVRRSLLRECMMELPHMFCTVF